MKVTGGQWKTLRENERHWLNVKTTLAKKLAMHFVDTLMLSGLSMAVFIFPVFNESMPGYHIISYIVQ